MRRPVSELRLANRLVSLKTEGGDDEVDYISSEPGRARRGFCRCFDRRLFESGASAGQADHQGLQPDPAGFQPAGLEHHEGARLRRQTRLHPRHSRLPLDLVVLCRFRDRRDRRRDRRTDGLSEALSARRAAADHRLGLHARRPGDFRQGPQNQIAGRPQRQETRHRHGRLAISGCQNLCRRQRHRPRQGHHRGQRQFRGGARPA